MERRKTIYMKKSVLKCEGVIINSLTVKTYKRETLLRDGRPPAMTGDFIAVTWCGVLMSNLIMFNKNIIFVTTYSYGLKITAAWTSGFDLIETGFVLSIITRNIIFIYFYYCFYSSIWWRLLIINYNIIEYLFVLQYRILFSV